MNEYVKFVIIYYILIFLYAVVCAIGAHLHEDNTFTPWENLKSQVVINFFVSIPIFCVFSLVYGVIAITELAL